MNDIDKGWLKWVALALLAGFLVGKIVVLILDKLLIAASFALLKNLMIPLFMIIGLLIVLYFYNKNKYEK